MECLINMTNKHIRLWKRTIKGLYFAMKVRPLTTLKCFEQIEKLQDKIIKEKIRIATAIILLDKMEGA